MKRIEQFGCPKCHWMLPDYGLLGEAAASLILEGTLGEEIYSSNSAPSSKFQFTHFLAFRKFHSGSRMSSRDARGDGGEATAIPAQDEDELQLVMPWWTWLG